jgi:hypothetical protein
MAKMVFLMICDLDLGVKLHIFLKHSGLSRLITGWNIEDSGRRGSVKNSGALYFSAGSTQQ